jgi:hypothetical protein
LHKVERFHSDGSKGFMHDEFTKMCAETNIIHTFGKPRTSDHGPTTRRIKNMTASSMRTSSAAMNLWWRALHNASTVLNAFLSLGTPMTPYELYHKNQPDLMRIAPFGCRMIGYQARKLNYPEPVIVLGSAFQGVYI